MMAVVVRTGDEALTCITTPAFVKGWEALLHDCTWSTACQHPDFIVPWYQIYRDRCSPVVVTEDDNDSRVIGILPLALVDGGKRLVGAGMVEAEYQCWIERPENSNQFIRKAIEAICTAFPKATLHLKYINVGAPVEWIRALKPHYFFRLQTHVRPLMKLGSPEIAKRLNSKNNRVKINRLKKIGAISFERVKDHQAFLASFDDICTEYDRRQKANNFVAPFQDDPLKGKLYKELHKRGILHATLLKVGNQVAAFHAGLISRDWLHHGVNGQSAEFEEHSPGKIHLLMLGAFLDKENFSMLDLTPGGDEYKEMFATQHDTVFEFFLFPGYFSFLYTQVKLSTRIWAKSMVKRLNIRPALLRQVSARFVR
jgi:CelD/BcsL family acetyltransferase involved in cellulose biosynthesis